MAILGLQMVFTMAMVSFLSKVMPQYSFAKYLLCKTGLMYYQYPSDDELREANGIPKKQKKKGYNKNDEDDNFSIPRNIDVELKAYPVNELNVVGLRFFTEYIWLIDFSVCSLIVYFISEVYTWLLPKQQEVNLSMLWCVLAIGFSLKIMFSLTRLYFKGNSGGETSMVVLSFFTYLLIALGMLIITEEILDIGLDMAYKSFNESVSVFLKAQGIISEGPASKVNFKVVLAFFCAFIGAFFTFPGIRLGKMHYDCLQTCPENSVKRSVLHASFVAPIFLVILWIRPLARHYFTEKIFPGYTMPLMTDEMFDISRVYLVLLVAGLRLSLMPGYLQSYLDMAMLKVKEQKKQTGRISNKDYQRMIAMIFYYLCIVTLQYITPLILCAFLSLMGKTLGGLQWGAYFSRGVIEDVTMETVEPKMSPSLFGGDSILETSSAVAVSLQELKKVFTPQFYRGVFSFATWWCVFSWFLSGTFGILYHSYFTNYQ